MAKLISCIACQIPINLLTFNLLMRRAWLNITQSRLIDFQNIMLTRSSSLNLLWTWSIMNWCEWLYDMYMHVTMYMHIASPDGWAVWGVVVSTRWWLLVDYCVMRNWDRILVRAVKGLISRDGMVSICPLLWQRDVKLQQTKHTYTLPIQSNECQYQPRNINVIGVRALELHSRTVCYW